VIFSYPLGFDAPVMGAPVGILSSRFYGKTRMGATQRWKNFEDMYNRLDSIPACGRQTHRQTDILRRHSPCYAYASRGKNC